MLPSYFHAKEPEILIATVQSLPAQVTWHPGFVQSVLIIPFHPYITKVTAISMMFTYLYSFPYVQNMAPIWPKLSHNKERFYAVYNLL